jgi:hypothetical protein
VKTPEVYKGMVSEQNVFSRIERGRKFMHTQQILAQLISSPRSCSLPKSTTYTVVKSQLLGLQLSRQILSVKIQAHKHVRM